MNIQLTYLTSPSKGLSIGFDQAIVSLGRSSENDLVVNDPHVSSFHARLIQKEGKTSIEDLGSTNGTFVDGRRISERTLVQPGSTIQLGTRVKLQFTPLQQEFEDRTLIGPQEGSRFVEPPAPAEVQAFPPKKKRFPTWVLFVVGGVVLLCLGVIVIGGGGLFAYNFLQQPGGETAQPGEMELIQTEQANLLKTQTSLTQVVDVSGTNEVEEAAQAQEATATAQALAAEQAQQATATAEFHATATAEMQATEQALKATSQAATQEAQITATAQAKATAAYIDTLWRYIEGNMIPEMLVYGPEAGTITQTDDGKVDSFSSGVSMLNGVITVDFYPPYLTDQSDWDLGIFFRDLGSNDEYRVVIDSTGEFYINNRLGDENDYLIKTSLTNLNLGLEQANQLVLLVDGNRTVFFLNGAFVAEVQITSRMEPGNISVVTNIQTDFVIPDAEVRFENFKIYQLVQ